MAGRRRKGGPDHPDRVVWLVAAVVVVLVSTLMGVVVIPALTGDDTEEVESEGLSPERLYTRHCSACHGAEGQGAIGPQLGDGAVAAAYPDIDDQIDVITDGRGQMPSFEDSLTEDEIRQVATYEREVLGREDTAP